MNKHLTPVMASDSYPNEMEINRLKLVKRKSKVGYLRYDVYDNASKDTNELLGTCTVMRKGRGVAILEEFVSLNLDFGKYLNEANKIGIPISV